MGRNTTEQIKARLEKMLEFQECDTCAALPGTPPLCRGCLHNREAMTYMSNALKIAASSPYGKFGGGVGGGKSININRDYGKSAQRLTNFEPGLTPKPDEPTF